MNHDTPVINKINPYTPMLAKVSMNKSGKSLVNRMMIPLIKTVAKPMSNAETIRTQR
jgi:hypothetical protein